MRKTKILKAQIYDAKMNFEFPNKIEPHDFSRGSSQNRRIKIGYF